MKMKNKTNRQSDKKKSKPLMVSIRTLSESLDTHRTTIRRRLDEEGIFPVALTNSPNGALRYWWHDIEAWLESLEVVI